MADRFSHFSLNIFKIAHYWNAIAADEMKTYGIKGIYGLYLLVLSQYPDGLTASQLTQLCGRDKADVSRAMTKFKDMELIKMHSASGYRDILTLSAKGVELAAAIQERAELALEIAGQDIAQENREILYQSLDSIVEQLEVMSQKGLPEGAKT